MIKNICKQSLRLQTINGDITLAPNETVSAEGVSGISGLVAFGFVKRVKAEEPKKEIKVEEPTEPKVEEPKKPKAKAPKCAKKVNQPEIE